MPLVMVVDWVAQPGHEERAAEILREMIPKTRQEPGCLHYDAHRSIEDPSRFVIYEVYRDQEALRAHEATEYFQDLVIKQALPLLESRVRRFFQPVS